MALDIAGYDALVHRIYVAALEPTHWPRTLGRHWRRLQLHPQRHVHILARPGKGLLQVGLQRTAHAAGAMGKPTPTRYKGNPSDTGEFSGYARE